MSKSNEVIEIENKGINNLLVLNEYDSKLRSISNCLATALDNFGYIGKYLCDIKEKELYKIEGYNDIYELAKDKFDLGNTSTKNFMNVYLKFGESGRGYISSKYKKYSYSQLVELLPVDEKELESYSPALPVKEIRVMKKISQMSDVKLVNKEFKKMSDDVYKIIENTFVNKDSIEKLTNVDIDKFDFETKYTIKFSKLSKRIAFSIDRNYNNKFEYCINISNYVTLYEDSFSTLLTKFKKELKKYYAELVAKEEAKKNKPKESKETTPCTLKNDKLREEFVLDINNWTLVGEIPGYNFKLYKFNAIPEYVMFMYSDSWKQYHEVKGNKINCYETYLSSIVDKLKEMRY